MIKYYNAGRYAPEVATDGSAGIDLFANTVQDVTIGTGVHVEIPTGHVGLLIPRSSWGLKGFKLANTVGVIDSDYRGEIKLVRDPHPTKGFLRVDPGDKIAQLVVVPCLNKALGVDKLEDLVPTKRGNGGFGSTGGA
jgi:dUTP pyrophosphatase